MISALILTRDEALDLPGCLHSLTGCSDIHVFDAESQDETCHIARQAGARVIVHPFEGYAAQRNAALQKCSFKFEWILVLDADERLPDGLFPLLEAAVREANSYIVAFRMRRRDFFEGRWLKHAQLTPTYIRLFRKDKAKYHREINELLEVDGSVADLPFHFDHHPFSKGLASWLRRHLTYAEKEARQWHVEQTEHHHFSIRIALCSSDPQQRRFHQKGLFYRMPFRPTLKWTYMMFVRLSFMDGMPGIRYARLQALYESWIVEFAREYKRSIKGSTRS